MADARDYDADEGNDDDLQQQRNASHADDVSADTSVFSTSSVDQFLRDNGFSLEDHGGADLSSLSGDNNDSLEQQFDLLGSRGVEYDSVLQQCDVRGGEDETARHGDSFRGTQSASEEEVPTTPRFTLFHEEDAKNLRLVMRRDDDGVDEEGERRLRESLFNLVQDMTLQLERKNQIIQDIILESNRNSKEHSRAEGNLASVEKKNEDIQNALTAAKAEIVRLKAKMKQDQEDANEQAKKLKQSCLKLQQQLKVSEHRVKAKEVLVDRMQQKLQQQVDKENLSKSRDRQVFRQIQQRDVKKTNARDNQSLEYINVYEAQREQMQEEIDQLKSQVTALNAELRDKENYIARKAAAARKMSTTWDDEDNNRKVASPVYSSNKSRRNTPTSVASDDMMLERLEVARREQEQAAAKLRRREAAMIKKEFKAAIVTELCKRSVEPSILPDDKENGNPQSTRTTLSRAINFVSELVELEKNVLHHREIYSQAATEIERRPNVLVNQIEIFLFTNEMTNFLNVVRELLNLKGLYF
uniref:Centrosomal protein of 70 kDa n=1 Tax=Globisporangium ultimum (strain ATCC 200006 / CBS 805.95 / DAOM BR144) TaxID=431595 RepID=K3WZZ1_GLOUD